MSRRLNSYKQEAAPHKILQKKRKLLQKCGGFLKMFNNGCLASIDQTKTVTKEVKELKAC